MSLKLLTVGSIPPEWGGPRSGGVANVHRTLLEEFATFDDLEIVGVIPTLKARDTELANHLPLISDNGESSYRRLANLSDVVLMFHIAHEFGQFQALHPTTPCIGSIRSWSPYLYADDQELGRERINFAMGGMSRLAFPSLSLLEHGSELGFEYPVATSVIHNPLSPTYRWPSLSSYRRGVVFVGSLLPVKRAHVAIDACRELGVELTIVGDGPERSVLEEIAGDHVRFTGELAPPKVRELISSAETLCVPSKSEGFSNAYVEAVACGTPIVGFGPNVAELSRALGFRIGIGVDPEAGAADVGTALRKVLDARWPRRKMRKAATRQFSTDVVARRYVDLMRKTISEYN